MKRLRVSVIGLGHAGTAVLNECIEASSVDVIGAWNRGPVSPPPRGLGDRLAVGGPTPPSRIQDVDLLLLAVSDRAVPEVAAGLSVSGDTAVVHLSGAADVSLLDSLATGEPGCWHPLQAFAAGSSYDAKSPPYAVALQGSPLAVSRGRQLAEALGHPAVELAADGRAAYHAAAVLASNCLVSLEAVAVRVMGRAGVPPVDAWKLLWPLVRGTLSNLEGGPSPSALTGPIARGDADTVRRNLAALTDDPGGADVYRSLGTEAVTLARARGVAPAILTEISALLACPPPNDD